MKKLGSLRSNGMTRFFVPSTVAPRKLFTLTMRLFLLSRSCMIPFKMKSPIMTAVPSGYFPCVSLVLFVAIGSLFLSSEFLNSQNFSFYSQITSSSWFCKDFLNKLLLVFFVGNKNFVIGICNFIIVVTSIFNTLLNCFLVLSQLQNQACMLY